MSFAPLKWFVDLADFRAVLITRADPTAPFDGQTTSWDSLPDERKEREIRTAADILLGDRAYDFPEVDYDPALPGWTREPEQDMRAALAMFVYDITSTPDYFHDMELRRRGIQSVKLPDVSQAFAATPAALTGISTYRLPVQSLIAQYAVSNEETDGVVFAC